MDDGTLFLRGALRFLTGKYPVRTFMGILFGLTLDGLRLFAINYSLHTDMANGLNAIPLLSEISIGVLMSFCTFALPGRRTVPEKVITYFNIIDETASRTNMSKHQKFLEYQDALNIYKKEFLSSDEPDANENPAAGRTGRHLPRPDRPEPEDTGHD